MPSLPPQTRLPTCSLLSQSTGTNIPGKYVSETHWATKDDFENWAK